MADEAGEKTHEPTAHRRQEARQQGQLVYSQDLTSAGLLVFGMSLLWWWGGSLADYFASLARRHWSDDAWLQIDTEFVFSQLAQRLGELAWAVLPLLGTLALVAGLLSIAQVGLVFLPEKLLPDFKRIDPLAGMGRVFSLANAVRIALGLVKIAIVGIVAWKSLAVERDRILSLSAMSVPSLSVALGEILIWIAIKIGAGLLILGALDYLFQWWKHERDLRMTTEEVREELKTLQGDPHILARRKAVQRQLVLNRLKSAVPKADVVITNPTELAIAIQYDAKSMAAPVVVAKGAGLLAEQIRRLALAHGIPIVEKKPLAQALYRDVEVNQPIQQQMYAAVAEVLAYVYQLRGKTAPR